MRAKWLAQCPKLGTLSPSGAMSCSSHHWQLAVLKVSGDTPEVPRKFLDWSSGHSSSAALQAAWIIVQQSGLRQRSGRDLLMWFWGREHPQMSCIAMRLLKTSSSLSHAYPPQQHGLPFLSHAHCKNHKPLQTLCRTDQKGLSLERCMMLPEHQ